MFRFRVSLFVFVVSCLVLFCFVFRFYPDFLPPNLVSPMLTHQLTLGSYTTATTAGELGGLEQTYAFSEPWKFYLFSNSCCVTGQQQTQRNAQSALFRIHEYIDTHDWLVSLPTRPPTHPPREHSQVHCLGFWPWMCHHQDSCFCDLLIQRPNSHFLGNQGAQVHENQKQGMIISYNF